MKFHHVVLAAVLGLVTALLFVVACSSGGDDDDDNSTFEGTDDTGGDDTGAGDDATDDADDDLLDDDLQDDDADDTADDDFFDDDAADDDATDDDATDDDATDDDVFDDDVVDDDVTDDDVIPPCPDNYNVHVQGQTTFDGAPTGTWTLELAIGPNRDLSGVVLPENLSSYNVSGHMSDASSGFIEGSFQTPPPFAPFCHAPIVSSHDEFTVQGGQYQGQVTITCGPPEGEVLSTGQSNGQIVCGSFN